MPRWLDALGGFIDRTVRLLAEARRSGVERASRAARRRFAIDRPFYVAGIARSGSTILLELLAGRPGVATHRYRDFPPIYTPLFWNRAFAQVYRSDAPPAERAHKDRILVTPDSPEAMEEVLWMRFFRDGHDEAASQVLDAATSNPAFERFYADHLKKILLVRGGQRYLSKGNYNLTRFAYLLKLFPDARFIVPVRDPRWHIASLMKQHRLFDAEERRDPRILKHMQRAGHFEFGLDRRVINVGDAQAASAIAALWRDGQEVRGWARYWAMLYGFVLAQQRARSGGPAGEPDRALRGSLRPGRGDACPPRSPMSASSWHPARPRRWPSRLSQPGYYQLGFTPEEEAIIAEETGSVAAALGYR